MNHLSWATALAYVFSRLKEVSTWTGIVAFGVGCGFLKADSPIAQQLPQLAVMLVGIIAAAIPTKPSAVNPPSSSTTSSHALVGLLAMALALPVLLNGCTVHNNDGTPIVVTADNAVAVVLLELQRSCQYKASADAATNAVLAALNASQQVQQTTQTVQTLASIACGLLAPPPAAAPAKPAAG